MMRKSETYKRREVKRGYPSHKHTETVRIECWWLLWVFPIYTHETVVQHNLC